jgi:hypothetical protein
MLARMAARRTCGVIMDGEARWRCKWNGVVEKVGGCVVGVVFGVFGGVGYRMLKRR